VLNVLTKLSECVLGEVSGVSQFSTIVLKVVASVGVVLAKGTAGQNYR